MLLPTLRADFEVSQTYRAGETVALDYPIFAYGGLGDPEVNREDHDAWRSYAGDSFTLRMFPGDHFFVHSAQALLLGTISKDILSPNQAARPQ